MKGEKNFLHTIKRKASTTSYDWRRNCQLKHATEGKIRLKQLLDNPKEQTGYWKLRNEALDRTWWRTGFGKGYETVTFMLPYNVIDFFLIN